MCEKGWEKLLYLLGRLESDCLCEEAGESNGFCEEGWRVIICVRKAG